MKLAVVAEAIASAWIVTTWLATDPMPFDALTVKVHEPPVAGVVPVILLDVALTQEGAPPLKVTVGAGKPVVVSPIETALPAFKVVDAVATERAGAWLTFRLKTWLTLRVPSVATMLMAKALALPVVGVPASVAEPSLLARVTPEGRTDVVVNVAPGSEVMTLAEPWLRATKVAVVVVDVKPRTVSVNLWTVSVAGMFDATNSTV